METKTLALYGGGAIVGIALITGVTLWATGSKVKTLSGPASFIKMDAQLPDDFYKTLLPIPEPEPVLDPPADEIVNPPEPNLPPVEPFLPPPAAEVFNFVEKAPEIPVDRVEERRKAILSRALFTTDISEEIDDKEARNRMRNLEKEFPDGKKSRDKDFSDHGLEKEIPTYPVDLSRVLTANKFIPAVLVTEVNSEIPSEKVIAQIESDVVAFHGNKILIPKGSQAIGSYQGVDSPDSLRMAIVWKRIITPDGINIKFTAEAGDAEGVAGLTGYVDARWSEKYGSALIFSSISALAQLSVPVNNDNAKAAADSFSKELSPVVAEQLRRALDKINRITIPKGERINISPLTDLWFKEPVNNEVAVVPTNSPTISNGK